MPKCSYCGENFREGTGKLFIKNTGQMFYFCGSKCQKNFNLGRDPKNVRWTAASRK